MQITEIRTDETLRELRAHGTPEFPFEYYYDDFNKFSGQSIAWHWHREFEFVAVDAGPIDCLIGAERLRMEIGSGLFINSGAIHRFESTAQGRMPNILFAPEFLAERDSLVFRQHILPVLNAGCRFIPLTRGTDAGDAVLHRLRRIFETAQSDSPLRTLDLKAESCALWTALAAHAGERFCETRSAENAVLQSRLQSMIRFIETHYPERIALADIAGAAGVSKSEALRCFHAGIQTSPVRFLTDYRLARGKALLLKTKDTVTAVALSVGFESGGYFSRMFHRAFGMTPKAFRAAASGTREK